VAFVRERATGTDLLVADPRGGRARVVSHARSVSDPQWAPDSTRLLFEHDGDLVVVGSDHRTHHLIRSAFALGAVWSPDGRSIAYVSSDGLHVVDAERGSEQWHYEAASPR
jgi:Tol biopolymer transport system component